MPRLFALVVSVLLLLTACMHAPRKPVIALPPLQLAPAALGQTLALQQRLQFHFGNQARTMDALLEVDPDEVRLVVQALGQAGVRLQWDGKTLQQQRAAWLPPAVRAERVLDDLQFTLWPVDAIRAVLPAGWSVRDDGKTRELLQGEQVWLSLTRLDANHWRLDNRAEGYQLEIASTAAETAGEAGTSP